MKREVRDIEMKLADAEERARQAIGEGNLEAAEKAMEEVRALRKQKAMLEELEAAARREMEAAMPAGERRDREQLEKQYVKVFVKAIRRRSLSADEVDVINAYRREILAAMHEGGVTTDPDGDASLIVPQDISTRINRLTREFADLSEYIRVEQVATLSGSRVLERDEDITPLAEIGEYQPLVELDNPKFTSIAYQLKKRAGYLPITNELLRDTDQNLLNYVTEWIARKVVVTRNTLIVGLLNTLTAQVLADLKAIKRVLNVDLDPAISARATVITNQDGFNWLDTQTDQMGRFLLQDDITQPGRKLLFGRPVVVVSNRYLPSREDATAGKTYAPVYIGDGRQFAVWFTRGVYELASTREGGEAWRRDTTELRVITRDDLRQWDAAAMVRGELDVTPAA